jgi:hypothetical protein
MGSRIGFLSFEAPTALRLAYELHTADCPVCHLKIREFRAQALGAKLALYVVGKARSKPVPPVTPDDATVRVSPAEPAPRRRAGRLGYVLAGFTFVFLGGSVVLWLLRKPVAEQALSAWCGARDLQCDGKFTELDASGITVSAVKVSSGAATRAEAA